MDLQEYFTPNNLEEVQYQNEASFRTPVMNETQKRKIF